MSGAYTGAGTETALSPRPQSPVLSGGAGPEPAILPSPHRAAWAAVVQFEEGSLAWKFAEPCPKA